MQDSPKSACLGPIPEGFRLRDIQLTYPKADNSSTHQRLDSIISIIEICWVYWIKRLGGLLAGIGKWLSNIVKEICWLFMSRIGKSEIVNTPNKAKSTVARYLGVDVTKP